MKPIVLFVDDEPNILAGLKRMLRILRGEMDFQFAGSGADALALLGREHVDVIVSDMRMPGMDGATLLTAVQERHPEIIRIMLTGQADEQAILRTVGIVHQFLAKPANPEHLKDVLLRASALQGLMRNESLKRLVSGLGQLPSLPSVYAELQRTLLNPECAISDVAAIIEKDLAMTAKILQLVNSAFFGLFRNIDSPQRAVNLLGLDTVKALVLGVGVFSELKGPPSPLFSLKGLWEHSMNTAAFAKTIALAENADKSFVDTVFIAGLMHDVGKLLMFTSIRDNYLQAVAMAREQHMTLCEAERSLFNADHGDVGGYLMGLWGLPGDVVEAIAFHHRLDSYPAPSVSPALVVHVADVLCCRSLPDQYIGAPAELDHRAVEQAGVAGKIATWQELCGSLGQGKAGKAD